MTTPSSEDSGLLSDRFTIVFDLDDTLYLERDYVRSGFRAVGSWIASSRGLCGFDKECQRLFDEGERNRIFNQALLFFGVPGDLDLVAKLVEIYRNHQPDITLSEDSERYLAREHKQTQLGMITDGIEATQRAKIRALNLEGRLSKIITTGTWPGDFSKPHPRSYRAIEQWCGHPTDRIAYIADNPTKDFVTPKSRGWWTIMINRPGRVHVEPAPDEAHEAHRLIGTLDDLDACLSALSPAWADDAQSD